MQQRKLTRLQAVINLIQQKKRISVDDLSKHFNVSLVTIRRDLEELERNGSLIRDYGGAVVNKTFVEEDILYEKYKINIEEKDKIAKYAASLVKDDDNIILDGGSTTFRMVPYLIEKKNLTVMTTGLNIAYELSRYSHINLILLGGVLRHKSLTFSDGYAMDGLANFNFNKMFFPCEGVDIETGITTSTLNRASMNQRMMEKSKEVILLADYTKFGKRSFCSICDIEKVGIIVSNKELGRDYLDKIRQKKIKIALV
jgi:DeoR family transcriptional regulator of aga operon